MNDTTLQRTGPGQRCKQILAEALVVLVAGAGIAFAANWISPRGLSLARNYFPEPANTGAGSLTVHTNAAGTGPKGGVTNDPAADTIVARLKEKGLSAIDLAEVQSLFRDPQYDQELIIFIDARDDRHYQEGHIPGAYQFDRYYPEKYLPTVLPACVTATKIVVYCAGGKCEDSEFAALALKDAGVPAERLLVFLGGITEWTAHRLPLELDARRSGRLKEESR